MTSEDPSDFVAMPDDNCCPFCGHEMHSRELFAWADEAEIYCPDCGYVEGIS
jgi:predicted RNA-binding Zn-ribbon protein involved in translation (DUF1610 family)